MVGHPDVCVPYREQDIDLMPVASKSQLDIEGEEMEEEGELQNSAIFRKIMYDPRTTHSLVCMRASWEQSYTRALSSSSTLELLSAPFMPAAHSRRCLTTRMVCVRHAAMWRWR